MNALLSILPIALLMVGCGNTDSKPNLTNTAPEKDPMESAVEWSKLQNRNGDTYIPNTDKPYSGWAKQNYDNEQIKVLAEFTDGSVTRLRQWQENGLPMWDIRYSKGKVSLSDVPLEEFWDSNFSLHNGLFTSWHENGQKWSEENYKDGKEDGLQLWWYENGQKDGEEKWKDGKRMSAETWKPNGEKCPETNLKEGNGRVVWYYESGQKSVRVYVQDGKLDGLETNWYENGQKQYEINYKDGKEEGLTIYYNEDGTEDYREVYKDGKLVEN